MSASWMVIYGRKFGFWRVASTKVPPLLVVGVLTDETYLYPTAMLTKIRIITTIRYCDQLSFSENHICITSAKLKEPIENYSKRIVNLGRANISKSFSCLLYVALSFYFIGLHILHFYKEHGIVYIFFWWYSACSLKLNRSTPEYTKFFTGIESFCRKKRLVVSDFYAPRNG